MVIITALKQDYSIFQGDNTPLKIIVYTDDDYTIEKNLTSSTITWILKQYNDSITAILTKTTGSGISVTDALNGELIVNFSVDDTEDLTGTYYHECRVVDSNGQARVVCYGFVTVSNSGII